MPDVIVSGPERGEGRRRPRPWLIVLVIAAALAGAVRLWGGVSPPEPPAPTALPLPTPVTATPMPAPTPTGRPAAFRLAGRPGSWPPGLRVLIPGEFGDTGRDAGPAVVAGAGQVRTVPGFGSSGPDRWVTIQRLPTGTAFIVQDGKHPTTPAMVRPDHGPAVRLGAGLDTVVAAQGGGFIAADSGWTHLPGRLASYTPTGHLRWERRLERGTLVQRDTPYGLLAQVVADPQSSSTGELVLLDARSGQVLRRIGAAGPILASTDEKVAWIPAGCDASPGHCQLAVTDLRTGQQRRYGVPSGWAPATAAFSPNGSMLALGFAGQHDFVARGDPDGYVSVLSLVTDQFERMPGLTMRAKQAPALGWDAGGELILGVDVDDRYDLLLRWRPGLPGPIVLPGKLPRYTAVIYLAVLPG
ncbi:MAG TPA: hypothetical protein VMU51_29045 [Mycobacteriales bacterium]|nr:hypothetical protein [Mycobacteriales bacterium]